MQRNWIGRSEGAEVLFAVDELGEDVPVFTTRPDTLYGATFFVLAPEHPLVERLIERAPNADELRSYVRRAAAKRGEERAAAEEKTGVFTGFFATNPVNEARIPIWVADYVLMDYGTGAIMAVPAHDERDEEFARRFDLPIVTVIDDDGKLIDSAQFSSLPADEGKRAIVDWLASRERGRHAISYRLRDWGFSRQRYWGCPIRSSIARSTARWRCRKPSCPCCCPRSRTTARAARLRSRPPRSGCARRARPAAGRDGARSRPWTPSSTPRGTSSATAIRTTRSTPGAASSPTSGTRSTSTSAGSTTRRCT